MQIKSGQKNSPGVPSGRCSSWRDKLHFSRNFSAAFQPSLQTASPAPPAPTMNGGVLPPGMPSISQPSSPEQPPGLCAELSLCDSSVSTAESHTMHAALGSSARATPGQTESDISHVLPFVTRTYSGLFCVCYV